MLWSSSKVLKICARNINGTLKLNNAKGKVLAALAECDGKKKRIYPSHKYLAKASSCSIATVKRSLSDLSTNKYISYTHTGRTNSYKIHFPAIIDDLKLSEEKLSEVLSITGLATEYHTHKKNLLVAQNELSDSSKCATNKLSNYNINRERENAPLDASLPAPDFQTIDLSYYDQYETLSIDELLEKDFPLKKEDLNPVEILRNDLNKAIESDKNESQIVKSPSLVSRRTFPVRKSTGNKLYTSSIKTQILDTFEPNLLNIQLASSLSLNIEYEKQIFIDHYLATEEKFSENAWQYKFRGWLRKAPGFNKTKKQFSNYNQDKPVKTPEQLIYERNKYLEEQEARRLAEIERRKNKTIGDGYAQYQAMRKNGFKSPVN